MKREKIGLTKDVLWFITDIITLTIYKDVKKVFSIEPDSSRSNNHFHG